MIIPPGDSLRFMPDSPCVEIYAKTGIGVNVGVGELVWVDVGFDVLVAAGVSVAVGFGV